VNTEEGKRTPTIEQRILAALRLACRRGEGPLTVAQLHARAGLTGRRSPEIAAACERLVDQGVLYPGWRRDRWVGARWTYRLSSPPEAAADKSPGKGTSHARRVEKPTTPRARKAHA
jgi:hypothetical protein